VALIEARRAMQGKKSRILKIGFEFGRWTRLWLGHGSRKGRSWHVGPTRQRLQRGKGARLPN
jgi:hypothetical protein